MPLSRLTTRARRRHALGIAPPGLGTVLSNIAEEVDTPPGAAGQFPQPTPVPISDVSSSAPSTPDSQTQHLPLTPISSNDELPLASPVINPKRVAVKPLETQKNIQRPLTLVIDDESDKSYSTWYTSEISNFLSQTPITSPTSSSIPVQDSVVITPTRGSSFPPPHWKRRRNSGLKSPILPSSPYSRCRSAAYIANSHHPSPRMSVPDDEARSPFCLLFYLDDLVEPESGNRSTVYSQASSRSTSLDADTAKDEVEEIEFPDDFDVQVGSPVMMFPLSFPETPIDLEADMARELEEIWKRNSIPESPKDMTAEDQRGLGVGFILEEDECDDGMIDPPTKASAPQIPRNQSSRPAGSIQPSSAPTIPLPQLSPSSVRLSLVRRPAYSANTATISTLSLPSSDSPAHFQNPPLEERQLDGDFDERTQTALKSRWSCSTLASRYEEEDTETLVSKLSGATRFRKYFQCQHKCGSSSISSLVSPKSIIPFSSINPSSLIAKAKEKMDEKKEKEQKKVMGQESESDILVIGYSNSFSGRPTRFYDFEGQVK